MKSPISDPNGTQTIASRPGGRLLWRAWLTLLGLAVGAGLVAWGVQLAGGLAVTNLSDHVPWGLYIGNFTFVVGLAAGGVLMAIPAWLMRDPHMGRVVLVGELVALCAVGMAGAFIVADLGRPDRLWHLLPLLGAFNWPASLFTWDVVALGGYAMLNAFILFASWRSARRHGDAHRPRWRAPFVVLAVTWAIAIHTVTAFLYAGLGARPFWHTALLAPRFLASAFVSGPALLLVILAWLARSDRSREVTAGEAVPAVSRQVRDTLVRVMRVTALVDLLMLASEVFVGLHAGGTEGDAVRLLVLGLDGHGDLVPWFWTALGLHVIGVGLLARPARDLGRGRLLGACGALFAAVWFEKGLGFLLPGFLPAPTDAVAAYRPSAIEWSVTGGIWAAGALALSLGLRAFGPLLRSGRAAEAEAEAVPTARETRPGQEGERAAPPRKGA